MNAKHALILGIGALILVMITKRNAIADEVNSRSTWFDAYDSLFKKYASLHGLADWRFAKAIAWNESTIGTHPTVVAGIKNPTDVEKSKSSDGLSWGVMQTQVATSQDMNAALKSLSKNQVVAWLNVPENSINVGVKYLVWVRNWLKSKNLPYDDWTVALSYNQGIGNTQKGVRDPDAVTYANNAIERTATIKKRNP